MILYLVLAVIVLLTVGFSKPSDSPFHFLARVVGTTGGAFLLTGLGLIFQCEMKWLPWSFCGEMSGPIHIFLVSCLAGLISFLMSLSFKRRSSSLDAF